MYLSSIKDQLEEQRFGGKASGLSAIHSIGLMVPEGYAIEKRAFRDYLDTGNIPPGLAHELEAILPEFSSKQLIVRSSAIGEDGAGHSFAGQLDSFVTENKLDKVLQSIVKCWEGMNNERLKSYQQVSGIQLQEIGVVVQRFIQADHSGVFFTRSPFSGKAAYCEYVSGGSEPLVSGRVTPESFSTDQKMEVPDGENIPFDHKQLIEDAMILKKGFKRDLDIEWICSGDQFYYVQARPIAEMEHSKVHWSNTNLNENYPDPISPLLYSVARDSYYHYFKNLSRILLLKEESVRKLEYDFANTVGIFGNRIYYNMTSIHNILAASPFQSYFQEAFNRFIGYGEESISSKQFVKKSSIIKSGINLVALNLSLGMHVKQIDRKVDAFVSNVSSAEETKTVASCFYEFLDLRFNQWYHAGLADFFSMLHYKLLGNFTKRIYGEESTGIHNILIQAIPGLISNEPLMATWKILREIDKVPGGEEWFRDHHPAEILEEIRTAEGWKGVNSLVEDYLLKWGFRCSGELMLRTDNYIESPVKFIELLRSYILCGQRDPSEVIKEKNSERRRFLIRTIGRLFRKWHILFPVAMVETIILLILTRLTRGAIYSRERVRYQQARMYYNFKRIVLKIGRNFKENGYLEEAEDILLLSYKEIGEYMASSGMFSAITPGIVASRKQEYNKQSKREFPGSFETQFGKLIEPLEDMREADSTGREFFGLAASGGKIRAKVQVLESVLEAKKLGKGDILVTKQTDPGWAMVFPIIGGIIVEHGGALSHGAIVAREFGIPAVLGIEGITRILKDNDEVILDGNIGKVQLI